MAKKIVENDRVGRKLYRYYVSDILPLKRKD